MEQGWFKLAPSQWETSLQSNAVSHWLGTNLESALLACIPTFQLITSKWASELSNLQETQKREYREWVMNVHEDTQTTAGTPTYVWVTEAWNESWIINVSCSQNFGHIEAREAPLVLWDCYVVWICVRSRYHPSIQCLRELLAGLSYLPWKKWLPFWQSTCSNGFFLMKMVEFRFKF